MTEVRLRGGVRRDLLALALAELPREACGALVGRARFGEVEVVRATRGRNVAPEACVDRFELEPLHVAQVDDEARAIGLAVVGVWHSHPRGPSVPSAADRAAASPGWIHAVVSVPDADVTFWQLAGGELVDLAGRPAVGDDAGP